MVSATVSLSLVSKVFILSSNILILRGRILLRYCNLSYGREHNMERGRDSEIEDKERGKEGRKEGRRER